MPFIFCTDETMQMELEQVLVTHVLTHNCKYLVNISCLLDSEGAFALRSGFSNEAAITASSDLDDITSFPVEEYHVSNNPDIDRLLYHSNFTEAIYKAFQNVESAANTSQCLLGELSRLIPKLHLNSAHGEKGKEELAGLGGSRAIADFFQFFDGLTEAQKKSLPASLKEQIRLFRGLY